ncbi:hypothetical protein BU26DRAFT_126549 [Trematosphaeria pertusa]|uniref:GPI mannosyltransferase 2 n=1 Tax=Trematosphaeria pertusa TaxID=390896 RepID=A0A6A6HYI1_9PLEO|nr:uncharacterized protein BU26DRAFT_126549 [Trematosphaeria pertusa]KAF2243111.1 hypothetical protein BU26DRAFT_126549 [Trematosphaeria pertusa]
MDPTKAGSPFMHAHRARLAAWLLFFFPRPCFALLVSSPCNFSLATRSAPLQAPIRAAPYNTSDAPVGLLLLFYTVHNYLHPPPARHLYLLAFASLPLSAFVLDASSYSYPSLATPCLSWAVTCVFK